MDNQLIGFCGWGRSGKDLSVKCLKKYKGFTRMAFADPLRDYLLKINPSFIDDRLFGWMDLETIIQSMGWDKAKEIYPDLRPMMQRLGHCLRDDDAYYWVKQLFSNLPEGNIAFSDVRCLEEWYAITGAGGKVYRINRPGYGPANDFEAENHSLSEVADQINIIENDGSIADLCKKVCALVP